MTLKEAVEVAEGMISEHSNRIGLNEHNAIEVLLDTVRQHLDDTAEMPLPCPTCGGKGEIVHAWKWDHTAAVSPCPTCVGKPTEVKS